MPKKSIFHKIQRKQHRPDRYRNPYFRREDKRGWKQWLVLVCTGLLFIGTGVFFLRAPYFSIETTVVKGAETIDPEAVKRVARNELERPRLLLFENNNRFLFQEDALEEKLRDAYAFESLRLVVEKRTLKITMKEKTSELLWYTDQTPYLVSLEGVIIRPLTQHERELLHADPPVVQPANVDASFKKIPDGEEGPKNTMSAQDRRRQKRLQRLPAFYDVNDKPVEPGSTVLEPREVENMFRFYDHLEAQRIGYNQTRVDRLAGQWVSVLTQEGYQIFMDPLKDIDRQAVNLQTVLRESVDDPSNLKYIDVRYEDHVFVK